MTARIAYWAVRLSIELVCAYLLAAALALAIGDQPGGEIFATVALPSALVFWAERLKLWLGCLPLLLTFLGYLFMVLMAAAFYAPVNALSLPYPLIPLSAFVLGRIIHRTA